MIFSDAANRHAPLIEKMKPKKMKKIPWYNEKLEALNEERTRRLQLYRLYCLPSDLVVVKVITNQITHLKRKLKRSYYTDKINGYDGDPKKIWQIMKEVTNTENIKTTTEPSFLNQELANTFNTFFATVGTNIQKKLNIITDKTEVNAKKENFTFKEETAENIEKLIDKMKSNIAVGVDDINVKLVKDTKQTIAETLRQLVNLSYKTSKFPK